MTEKERVEEVKDEESLEGLALSESFINDVLEYAGAHFMEYDSEYLTKNWKEMSNKSLYNSRNTKKEQREIYLHSWLEVIAKSSVATTCLLNQINNKLEQKNK